MNERKLDLSNDSHVAFCSQTVKELIVKKDASSLIVLSNLLRKKPYNKKIYLELDEQTIQEGAALLTHHYKIYHQQKAQELDEKRKIFCRDVVTALKQAVDDLNNTYTNLSNQITIQELEEHSALQSQRIQAVKAYVLLRSLKERCYDDTPCLFHTNIGLPAEQKSIPDVQKEIQAFQAEITKTISTIKDAASTFQSLILVQTSLK